jgi:hypothetical protein
MIGENDVIDFWSQNKRCGPCGVGPIVDKLATSNADISIAG